MVSTTIPLTLSLAIAFGVYLIAGGVAVLRLGDKVTAMLAEFERSPALTYLAGLLAFVLGVTIILVHHVWTDLLAGFITLFGWVAAIEGLILIAFPDALWPLARSLAAPSMLRPVAIGILIVGLVLLLAGLTGTAGR